EIYILNFQTVLDDYHKKKLITDIGYAAYVRGIGKQILNKGLIFKKTLVFKPKIFKHALPNICFYFEARKVFVDVVGYNQFSINDERDGVIYEFTDRKEFINKLAEIVRKN